MASLPHNADGEPTGSPFEVWAVNRPNPGSDLFDLTVFQFHRSGAAEDRNRDLEPGLFFVHFLDHAGEGGEGAVVDPDLLSNFESDRRLGPLDAFLNLIDDPFRFGLADRLRLAAAAQEAGHLRRV